LTGPAEQAGQFTSKHGQVSLVCNDLRHYSGGMPTCQEFAMRSLHPTDITLDCLQSAAAIVHRVIPPTPQYSWPLLNRAVGAQVWVKHENHTPIGAFKVQGGLVYFHELMQRAPNTKGVIAATRGNHGQSVGFAAARHGLHATIVVPKGNSPEKNAAMRALGVSLLEHGDDFQESREYATGLAAARNLHLVPAFHRDVVRGVATSWLELFSEHALDVVYVPVGQGSGICGAVAARDALRAACRIVGVVSAHAPCYKLSFEVGYKVSASASTQLADGLACRVPDEEALATILRGVDDIIAVTDDEIAAAIRLLWRTAHNVAEGAGAAALAGVVQQRERLRGQRVGIPLSGGNIDQALLANVLAA
jgi:threonine dehydratase